MEHKRTYPRPARDTDGHRITMGMGADLPDDLNNSLLTGHYLNRVPDLAPRPLADGADPDEFPSLDEVDAYKGMYVVDITHYDDQGEELDVQDKTVTLFDLRQELEFDVPALTFIAHYGTTIWNTNDYWDED